MNIICQFLYYQYILDKFHFFKSPKTFRVIITIILCCPCYMLKYIPRLEGIMHSPSGRPLCILTLGHISAYNMDNTILLYKYHTRFVNKIGRGRRVRDRQVVGFTTIYAISAYHHWCCEFESQPGRGVQNYVMKFVVEQSVVFSGVLWFPPPIKVTTTI